MICSNCQHQNPENMNFCMNCGAPLRYSCPNCKQVNAATATFCSHCGQVLGVAQTPKLTPPSPSRGQAPLLRVFAGSCFGILLSVLIPIVVVFLIRYWNSTPADGLARIETIESGTFLTPEQIKFRMDDGAEEGFLFSELDFSGRTDSCIF